MVTSSEISWPDHYSERPAVAIDLAAAAPKTTRSMAQGLKGVGEE